MDKQFFKGKTILITGAAGTVGSELVKQLASHDVKELVLIDNNESELFFLLNKFKVRGYAGDICNKEFLMKTFTGVDIIFHCAAMKHVILGERSPDSVIESNIIGLQNVIDAALYNDVEKLIFTSSDKAVNPTNVMGTSKLMGERIVTATNSRKHGQKTIFCSTRFGNVIGSRGSVFLVFKKQIKRGGPITLTDRKMSRFVMTIPESVKLILEASVMAEGGEVFVTKMPVMRIEDLAYAMRDIFAPVYGYKPEDIEIEETGSKPGEKLYEELMSDEEIKRAYEYDRLFSILPAFRAEYEKIPYNHTQNGKKVNKAYNSANEEPFSIDDIKDYLKKHKLVEGNE
ncbi:MAG: polysaccharide biosynthesis protein [Candidatus Nanoarchaeia archaeon]